MFSSRCIRTCIFLWFITFISGVTFINGQSCPSVYFQSSYQHLNNHGPEKIIPTASGGIMAGAETSYGYNIKRFSKSGKLEQSRFFLINSETSIINSGLTVDTAEKMIIWYNQNIVSIDTSCNMLDIKRLVPAQYSSNQPQLTKIVTLTGGDKIALFVSTRGGFIFVRLSGDLANIKWSVYYQMDWSSITDFILDGDKIIAIGTYSLQERDSQIYPLILSLNSVDGKLVHKKVFYTGDNQNCYPSTLIKTKNQYIIDFSLNNLQPSAGNNIFVRLDSAMNVVSAKRVTITYLPNNTALNDHFFFNDDNNGGYYMIGSEGSAFATASIYPFGLSHISDKDSVLWTASHTFYLTILSGFCKTNEALWFAGYGNYTNVVTQGLESHFVLGKSTLLGSIPNCSYAGNDVKIQLSDTKLTDTFKAGTVLTKDTSFVLQTPKYSNQNGVTFFEYNRCSSAVNCNSIKLQGDTAICLSLPILFKVTRNNGCINKPEWVIQPSGRAMITENSDTSVSVTFFQSGTYQIKSTLANGCSNAEDSMFIHVNLSAVSLGNDTTLCPGNTITLTPGNQFKQYTWQDGSTTSQYKVIQPGTYTVSTLDYCGNKQTASVKILPGPIYTFPQHVSDTICNGQSLSLKAANGFSSYTWLTNYRIDNPSSQTVKVSPLMDTLYIVSLKDAQGCTGNDSFRVKVQSYPLVRLPGDTTLCDNSTLRLNVKQADPATKYRWQDGSSNPYILATTPGRYNITVSINGCTVVDTVNIFYQYTPSVNLGKDIIKCIKDTVLLNAYFKGATYQWQDGSTNSVYAVVNPGTYYCTIKNLCSAITDTVRIRNEMCECSPIIPNVFSPNGDGIHDILKIETGCTPSLYSFQIFNREGHVIFYSTDLSKTWDGTFNGNKVPVGTYYYILKVMGRSEERVHIKSGSVTVIR